MKRHDLTRYGMAAILTTCLCLPAVWRTVAYPSASDVWCYGMVATLSVSAFCTSLMTRHWPRPHALDAVVLLWALYVACNYWFLSPYPATEDFREAEALCLAYAALRLAIPFCGKAFGQVWTAGLCLAGLYQTYTGIAQLAGWEPSHHYRYALTGTFFNPGPYAILVAIALAVAAAWLYNHKGAWTGLSRPDKVSRATVYALWAAGLPVLAATWSRTAWVALAVALAVMLWRGHRRMVLGGLAAAAILGACAYFMKQGSADGRLLMAIVAGKAWMAEWLTGHGLGGFAHAYGEAQAAFFAGHPDSPLLSVAGSPEYAFNGLAGVGVEQGLIGMACAHDYFVDGFHPRAKTRSVGLRLYSPARGLNVFLSVRPMAVPPVGYGMGGLRRKPAGRNRHGDRLVEKGRRSRRGRIVGRACRMVDGRNKDTGGSLQGIPCPLRHTGCRLRG